MVAVFNAPENGDSFVANEARTSDAPQFDLQTLYSDLSATTRGGDSGKRETGNQIDFGIDDNLYARANDSQSSSQSAFGVEQQGAMDIAKRFASFDDDTNENNNNISLDREDVGRLVEVYGDMYNAQNSLQEGDKSEAADWLGEMRRDLASFTKGLFGGSDEGSRERHGNRQDEHDGAHRCPEAPGSDGEEGGHEEELGSENGSDEEPEESAEQGWENLEECESSDGHGDTGTEGYTPEDSMVLLMNDMQELSEALASGDTEAVQKIMARMNRHLALLMRQLNAQKGKGASDGEGEGAGQDPYHNPFADGWFGTGPVGRTRPTDERPDIFNPFNPELGLPNPSDILPTLPRLPNPGDTLDGLPNPGDRLGRLPQPPNPQDLLRNLPQPPNPNDLLRNLPSPGDLFDIF